MFSMPCNAELQFGGVGSEAHFPIAELEFGATFCLFPLKSF